MIYWICIAWSNIYAVYTGYILPGAVYTQYILGIYCLEQYIRSIYWMYIAWSSIYALYTGYILPRAVYAVRACPPLVMQPKACQRKPTDQYSEGIMQFSLDIGTFGSLTGKVLYG